ncbi:hypothetical protein [Palleronia rufa]|uniref:hypothetical protein n=1 Tax=Palleronia rufa TaxID=1530186 RepID=UPI0009DCDFBB|nr:hypothetical protein [Palleronia rufa]
MTELLDRIRSALIGLKMPRAMEALDHTWLTPTFAHSAANARSVRTAVLGWMMREGSLLYDARLGQHMKLGHNPARRTGEAA